MPRFCANLSMLFTELPLLERFGVARAAGFEGVEILFPYGATNFASKMGQLAGNHFATIESGGERLAELGNAVLWQGAQPIRFQEA